MKSARRVYQAAGFLLQSAVLRAEADRWWSSIFLPLPAPWQLLPKALVGQEGLVRASGYFEPAASDHGLPQRLHKSNSQGLLGVRNERVVHLKWIVSAGTS